MRLASHQVQRIALGVVLGGVVLAIAARSQSRPAQLAPTRGNLFSFFVSGGAKPLVRSARGPLFDRVRAALGLPAPAGVATSVLAPSSAPTPAGSAAVSGDCAGPAAGRFNLEPRVPPGALPQNGTSVDFLPAAGLGGSDLVVGVANDFRGSFGSFGDSLTGYYVHRGNSGTGACGADFEGGMPNLIDQTNGDSLRGSGDTQVAADPARSAFFAADERSGGSNSVIGLFRTTPAVLNSDLSCPAGTHTPAVAATCWPKSTGALVLADGSIVVKPHLAVDVRPTGRGAGDVYVVATQDTVAGTFIVLAACRNDLTQCSSPIRVSGPDVSTDLAWVRVRPGSGGGITVSYVNVIFGQAPEFQDAFQIRFVRCLPGGAPAVPSCAAPITVATESQPLQSSGGDFGSGALFGAQFQIDTYPKHEHRTDPNGIETYIVWDRCKVAEHGSKCPDADIAMAASNDGGNTWNFGLLDGSNRDQYFPAISSDPATGMLTVAYYSAVNDRSNHRPQVLTRQIPPGPATPDAPGASKIQTTLPMEPAGDFFLGNSFIGANIGVASRSGSGTGGRVYVHFMHNVVGGSYQGASAPEQNNHLSSFTY